MVSRKDQSEAQKHAKYAVSALQVGVCTTSAGILPYSTGSHHHDRRGAVCWQFNDVQTAVQELQQALALLRAA